MKGEDKLWMELGGEPLLARTMRTMVPFADELVVVAPASKHAAIRALQPRAVVVEGGERRQDSVRAGLEAVSDCDYLLVHDAARPLVTAGVINAVLQAAQACGAAIPVIAPADSIKEVAGDKVVRTLPRQGLRLVQTPQGFATEILRAAHEHALSEGVAADDDAALVEAMGQEVAVVAGDIRNLKVTTPADVAVIKAWLEVEV